MGPAMVYYRGIDVTLYATGEKTAGNCSVLKTGRTQRGRQILESSPVNLNLSRGSEGISECRKISDPEVESPVICTWIGDGREITLQG